MIFGQTHPLTHLSAGLGAATAGTKRLRTAMNKLVQITGDKNFRPCPLAAASCPNDGDITKTTVYALIYAITHLAGKVPGADELGSRVLGGIQGIPKVGELLALVAEGPITREKIDFVWDTVIGGAVIGGADDPRPKIIDFVRRNADDLAKAVETINKGLELAGVGPKVHPALQRVLAPVSPTTATRFVIPGTAQAFPPGSVAVRDPIENVYRILAPPL